MNLDNSFRTSYAPKKENLLQILHEVQDGSPQNYISPENIQCIADYLNITKGEVTGVVEYYSMLSMKPRGKYVIRICKSPVCSSKGGRFLADALKEKLGICIGEMTEDGMFSLESCECLGHCYESPAMMINQKIFSGLSLDKIDCLLKDLKEREDKVSITPQETRVILRNIDRVDPENIHDYVDAGGYKGFINALKQSPDTVREELIKANFIGAGLKGRGGAGFSTGMKMQFTSQYGEKISDKPVYLVCNADEGEPGTFKDRIIMEKDPHSLLEGMLLTAYYINSNKGFIYIRGEYYKAINRIQKAIDDAYKQGYLGKNILGSDFTFDLEVKLGAGSYLCGEELTLIESLEGKRGYPRIKPPFPAEKGLFGCPTLVNNVETLANIPPIINNGAEWFKKLGTEKSTGTKIFTLSGAVNKPGYYEMELGVTLRDIIYNLGAGITTGTEFKGALLGGAAGTFVGESLLDTKMGYEELKEVGATLGSGAVIVFNNYQSIYDVLESIIEFFYHESCGKCVPCRVGTKKLLNLIKELKTSGVKEEILEKLIDEADYMAKNSLCPLGQSPILPIKSAVKFFRSELAR